MTLPRALYGRRVALAALAIGVVAVLALLALVQFEVVGAEKEERAENLEQLGLYRGEIAARPEVEAAFRDMHARVAAMPGLLHAEGGAPAAAQLQSAVKDVVEGNSGEIRSAQVLPSVRDKGFEVVAVEYDLTVPFDKFRDLAYALETHTPYLFIDQANISAPINWDPKNASRPVLEVRWVIKAYRWIDAR